MRSFLAILCFGLGVFGFFHFGIFVGPPAVVLAVLALYTTTKEEELELLYRVLAFIGLALGTFETIFGILELAGMFPQPY